MYFPPRGPVWSLGDFLGLVLEGFLVFFFRPPPTGIGFPIYGLQGVSLKLALHIKLYIVRSMSNFSKASFRFDIVWLPAFPKLLSINILIFSLIFSDNWLL